MRRILFIIFISSFSLIVLPKFALADDWKIGHIFSDKVCYKPGQTANFSVMIKNVGKQTREATLRFIVISEIDQACEVRSLSREFKPSETFDFKASWPVPMDSKWGHEIRLEILTPGQKPLIRNDFFATGKHPWQVGHWTTAYLSEHPQFDRKEIIYRIAEGMRRWHYTAIDYFAWEPSCWETMAPKVEKWASGQKGWPESISGIKAIIDAAHEIGAEVYSYVRGDSWGAGGAEFLRENPELWWFDKFGKPFGGRFSYDIQKLDEMRKIKWPPPKSPDCRWDTRVMWFDDYKQRFFDQMKASVELLGWDGFRSDGLPIYENVYDGEGNYHQVVDKSDPIGQQIRFIKEIRDYLHENVGPDCQLHFNADSISYGAISGRRLALARAKDSYALWEIGKRALSPGSDIGNMKRYAEYLREEVGVSRKVNGYRHVGWFLGSIPEIFEAVTTACGAKVDLRISWDGSPSPVQREVYPFRNFVFRFSRYFWDPDLKQVKKPEKYLGLKNADHIWWKDLVQQRIEKDGTRYMMIHLINTPEDDQFLSKKTSAVKENVVLEYTGSHPKKVCAYLLSSDWDYKGFVSNPQVEIDGKVVRVTIPKIKIWSVVVLKIIP